MDTLAISFGTLHRLYRGEPKLNFDIVRAVKARPPVKLLMHGASGLPDHEYGNAAVANAAWEKRGGNLHLFEMLMSGKQAMADRTAHYMNLISAGPKLARERHG